MVTSAGFCRQEFVMDKHAIQLYVLPNGSTVVRAFCAKNFQCFDDNGMRISLENIIGDRQKAQQFGHEYEIQNNRMNSRVVS